MTAAYSRTQIVLHWLIFALIVLQFVLHEPISEAWDRIEDGLPVEMSGLVAQHVFTGLLVLVLVIWRLSIRLRRGAPPLPENEPAVLKLAAHATHAGLYGLMILMPVSGAVAWFGGVEGAAEAHDVMRALLLLLVLLHIGGALFQSFFLRSDVMRRMTRG